DPCRRGEGSPVLPGFPAARHDGPYPADCPWPHRRDAPWLRLRRGCGTPVKPVPRRLRSKPREPRAAGDPTEVEIRATAFNCDAHDDPVELLDPWRRHAVAAVCGELAGGRPRPAG